ncbi:MAG: hypothetical protein IKJ01_02135 [Lachnospiraceae bacterium]|nr:hypothetical protein [Lachnospiraceae bacterium]
MLNVNSELNAMKNYIADINHCTSKVQEVGNTAVTYRVNVKINIMTILTTIFCLVCVVFMQFNLSNVFVSVELFLKTMGVVAIPFFVVGIILGLMKKNENSNQIEKSFKLNLIILIASFLWCVCVYYSYMTYILIGLILINWLYTIVLNFKLKNQIWKISNNL